MLAAVIHRLLDRRPFEPFELRYGDEEYQIQDASLARIVDEDSTLAVFDPTSGETTFVNLLIVQRVRLRGEILSL